MMTYTKKWWTQWTLRETEYKIWNYNEILVQLIYLIIRKKTTTTTKKTLLKRIKNIVSMFYFNVPQQQSRKDWNISKISEPSVILTSEIKNDTVRNC